MSRIWVGVVAVGAIAAAVLVLELAAGPSPHVAQSQSTVPSPSVSLTGPYVLAARPFLTNADVGAVRDPVFPSPPMPSCITDPRTWGAAESRAATYTDHMDSTTRVEEFLLRFHDTAWAHRALIDAWTQLATCAAPPGAAENPLSDPPSADPDAVYDEGFTAQLPLSSGERAYVLRVGRTGNVVIIEEDNADIERGVEVLLRLAIERALPKYSDACNTCGGIP